MPFFVFVCASVISYLVLVLALSALHIAILFYLLKAELRDCAIFWVSSLIFLLCSVEWIHYSTCCASVISYLALVLALSALHIAILFYLLKAELRDCAIFWVSSLKFLLCSVEWIHYSTCCVVSMEFYLIVYFEKTANV